MNEKNKSSGLKVFLYSCGLMACTAGAVKSCEASMNYNKQHNISNFGVVSKTHDLEVAEANNVHSIWAEVCAAGMMGSIAGLLRERRKNIER